ncbi:MAG: sigma-54-dependent Fis family transcriptional regulator [Ignavibacteriae bacterium]|nr:sigma-54-dependent Fis family transcriptional regulator [Ignavibacteriota bacterium]MCB9221822.1 sigma-54-dependent Fis family transcriptional regulator [Ignavibacteria bacterium]
MNVSTIHSDKLLEKKFGIIGSAEPMRKAKKLLLKAAPTELSVLITGETGTGKEVFAKAVHGLSKRKGNNFVSVNCGAIPETLLESELFGHEKGAFTSAAEQRKGFFETADKGTIFLDEIGEMPFETQVKLLRVLESGEFSRLGSSDIRKVDVRVIAATNRELEERVEQKQFRQDLYFRLRSVHIQLPSLREHPEDIEALFYYFANNIANKIGLDFKGISHEALEILKSQTWEGNVRELKNITETMLTLEAKEFIESENVTKYIRPSLPRHTKVRPTALVTTNQQSDDNPNLELGIIFRTLLEIKNDIQDLKHEVHFNSIKLDEIVANQNEIMIQTADEVIENDEMLESFDTLNLADIEKRLIVFSLNRFEGNRRLAAKELGISERTLYRKLKQYDLE